MTFCFIPYFEFGGKDKKKLLDNKKKKVVIPTTNLSTLKI